MKKIKYTFIKRKIQANKKNAVPKEPIDLFDTEYLEDLPKHIRPYGRGASGKPLSKEMMAIVKLFEKKNPLTTPEIVVGLFRKFGIERNMSKVSGMLTTFIRKGMIKPTETVEKTVPVAKKAIPVAKKAIPVAKKVTRKGKK